MEDAIADAAPRNGKPRQGRAAARAAGRAAPRRRRRTRSRAGIAAAPRPDARLRAQRDHADPPRSGPTGVRLRRVGAADAGLRLRHHHRRRAHPLRLARSATSRPRAARYLEQFAGVAALLHRHAAGLLRRRGARAAAVGRRLGGARDPAQLRPGLPPRRRPGGPGAGGRRDDVPRRHRRAVRPGRARTTLLRDPAHRAADGDAPEVHGRHRRAVHVQPDVREHLLDRAERPGAAAAPDPGDPDDGQHRAREGAGLDDQLLRHADRAGSSTCWASSSPTSRSA